MSSTVDANPVPPAAFPFDFQVDTDHFHVALAEWNYRERTLKNLPRLGFGELTRQQVSDVLYRAEELKRQVRR